MNANNLYEHYRSLGFSKKTAIEMAQKKIFEQSKIQSMDSKALIMHCLKKPMVI